MRLPRPRFRLWTLLVLVAIIALGLGGEMMRRRRAGYLRAAAEHATKAARYGQFVEAVLGMARDWDQRAVDEAEMAQKSAVLALESFAIEQREQVERNKKRAIRRREDAARIAKLANYHAAMKRKYQQAARYPWLPVAPDLPKPDPPKLKPVEPD
jgi:hypothetical protein